MDTSNNNSNTLVKNEDFFTAPDWLTRVSAEVVAPTAAIALGAIDGVVLLSITKVD